jgi:hypothetical protein
VSGILPSWVSAGLCLQRGASTILDWSGGTVLLGEFALRRLLPAVVTALLLAAGVVVVAG